MINSLQDLQVNKTYIDDGDSKYVFIGIYKDLAICIGTVSDWFFRWSLDEIQGNHWHLLEDKQPIEKLDQIDYTTEKEVIQAVKDYLGGMSAPEIAERYNVTTSAVLYWLKKTGIETRPKIRVRKDWEKIKQAINEKTYN